MKNEQNTAKQVQEEFGMEGRESPLTEREEPQRLAWLQGRVWIKG